MSGESACRAHTCSGVPEDPERGPLSDWPWRFSFLNFGLAFNVNGNRRQEVVIQSTVLCAMSSSAIKARVQTAGARLLPGRLIQGTMALFIRSNVEKFTKIQILNIVELRQVVSAACHSMA